MDTLGREYSGVAFEQIRSVLWIIWLLFGKQTKPSYIVYVGKAY